MPSTKSNLATFGRNALKSVSSERVEVVDLTPEMAEEFLTHNKHNRNLRNRAVARYSRDAQAGDWLFTGESIKFDWDDRMIDGQHRCEMVVATGITVRTVVVYGLDPKVQTVLDTNARRTAADALKFAGIDRNLSEIAGAARIAKGVDTGVIRTALSGHAPVEMTNTEVLEWVEDNMDVLEAAPLARRVAKKTGAAPSALTYCIWRLTELDPFGAEEFFSSIAEYRTDGEGDPRLTLVNSLQRLRDRKAHLTAGIQLYFVFRAWEAWKKNESASTFIGVRKLANGRQVGNEIPFPKAA